MVKRAKGFTLIELLIVVAIIAILAAIAIPNFLAAQTRSKVSRAKADMRSLATALESYVIDFNVYPSPPKSYGGGGDPYHNHGPHNNWTWEGLPLELSSPVAYISNAVIWDPFLDAGQNANGRSSYRFDDSEMCIWWRTYSSEWWWLGDNPVGENYYAWVYGQPNANVKWVLWSNGPDNRSYTRIEYDPTNGTVSNGDLYRWGP